MAIAERSVGAPVSQNGVESVNVALAAGVVENDIMEIIVYASDDIDITTAEPDWNKVGQAQSTPALDMTMAVFLKRAGASEAGPYQFDISGGVGKTMMGVMSVYSGVDTTTMQDGSATFATEQQTATFDPSAADTASADAWVLSAMAGIGLGLGIPDAPTTPGAYTKFGTVVASNQYLASAYRLRATAGTEDPGVWDAFNSAVGCAGITLTLKPAGAAAGGLPSFHGANRGIMRGIARGVG